MDISPFDRQRTQSPLRTHIRDAIPAPVVANGEQIKALSSQRMERMRYGKNFCSNIATVCNARFFPRASWKRA